MAKLLLGSEVTAALHEQYRAEAERLAAAGVTPALAIVRVGARPDDLSYERAAVRRAEKTGVAVRLCPLPEDAGQAALLETIRALNRDEAVHGVLLFRPLPAGYDEEAACAALDPEKDADGITSLSAAGVFLGSRLGWPPCTPSACLAVLDHYGVSCEGKRVTIVGRSRVVGRPLAMMLLGRNATVTLCHTKTADLAAECRRADILVAAAGRAGVIGEACLRPGQIAFVGDSATDMKTARGAGMLPVGVLWGFRTADELTENGARHLIDRPDALLDLLDGEG